jgi:hypothetical protein
VSALAPKRDHLILGTYRHSFIREDEHMRGRWRDIFPPAGNDEYRLVRLHNGIEQTPQHLPHANIKAGEGLFQDKQLGSFEQHMCEQGFPHLTVRKAHEFSRYDRRQSEFPQQLLSS